MVDQGFSNEEAWRGPMISGKPKGELYFSVDVETTGGGPLTQNLTEIGAVVVGDHSQTFHTLIAPLKTVPGYAPNPEAMAVHGRSIKELAQQGISPMKATTAFKSWVFDTAGARRPVFVSFGTYDWMWCGSYFDLYGGRYTEPFGPNTLDLKSFYAGWRGVDFTRAAKRYMPDRHLGGTPHTHHALEDAIEQAIMFERWLTEMFDQGLLKRSKELKKIAAQLISQRGGFTVKVNPPEENR